MSLWRKSCLYQEQQWSLLVLSLVPSSSDQLHSELRGTWIHHYIYEHAAYIVKVHLVHKQIYIRNIYPPSPIEMAPAATSAIPAMRIMEDGTSAPDKPAARAKGTVRPSETPMMMSRTISLDMKCFSSWSWRSSSCFSRSVCPFCAISKLLIILFDTH